MRAINLKCEYLKDPVGIDIANPRLFWNCEDGIRQTAYEVITYKNGVHDWQSGRVESASMCCIYGGSLKSRDRIEWNIRLYDENGECGEWSKKASFELGLLFPADWSAKWMSGGYRPRTKRNRLRPYFGGKAKRYPVDQFRKEFACGKVSRARLYITACGLYEARLNGRRVGNFVLAPGYTDYTRRIQYQTYDVTDMLNEGENELCIDLADGWYRGGVGAWGCLCEYGFETKILAQLEIADMDGKVTVIDSGNSFAWCNDGPIRFADNKDGERVDARRVPSYSGRAKVTKCSVIPTASNNVPVTEHETFKPSLIVTPSGQKVLDFGQNIAGYISFVCSAKAGQNIRLRFGEMLDSAGEFTQKNFQLSRKGKVTPMQRIEYICKDGENRYKTAFAVFGFQYALVEADCDWKPEDFVAIAVYSDMERTGYFRCSNRLLNKFVENTVWSAKNNHLDIPTDCPTRERHGWAGDAQIFARTASYLFGYAAFSRKYINDLYDWQKKNGKLPQIAPYGGVDFFMSAMDGSVGWADAGILIPYCIWKQYGDKRLLKDLYPQMKRYAAFLEGRIGKWYITAKSTGLRGMDRKNIVNAGQSFGEWAEPAEVHATDWIRDTTVPHPEESTAYTSFVLGLMAQIAEALGYSEDEKHFTELSGRTRQGYQALRRLPEYTLDTDRQACLVRPLYMNLLDSGQEKYARERLIKALGNYGWRLGTGFLSTPFILYVLADFDIEAAYRLLENEEMPGWLFMPKTGANTIWESWEGTQAQGGIASLDHYSKGAVCEWLFDSCCGIKVDGENRFVISPKPGGSLTFAEGEYRSIYGTVRSAWRKEGGSVKYVVEIPCNCTAAVLIGGKTQEIGAGKYEF